MTMEIQELVQESSPYHDGNSTHEKRHLDTKTDVHFIVDDLLDFPSDDVLLVEEGDNYVADTSTTDSSTALDSSNSSPQCGGEPSLGGDEGSGSFVDTQLSNLYVPNDDLAHEFEWLSNFMEESFSHEDLQKLQLISGVKAPSKFGCDQTTTTTYKETNKPPPVLNNDMTHVPGKARTKRSRAVSSNWASSQLQVFSPIAHISSSYESDNIVSKAFGKKKLKTTTTNNKQFHHDRSYRNEDGRKCVHCATDKTPQWRSGPMGPKTLCNACGVRYKSGRLVPEYRPASSPTFVLTKHSNSHRKVLELQRQKVQKSQHHQQQFMHHQNAMLPMHDGDDYLTNQNTSRDYRQLI